MRPTLGTRTTVSRRWPIHLMARLRCLRRRLVRHRLDGLLVSHPPDIRYLSGFSGEDSWLLLTRTGLAIISDRRFEEELARGCPYAPVVMRKRSLAEELPRVVRAKRIRRLGLQAEHISLQERKGLVKGLGAGKLWETTGWLLEARALKDSKEVALIQGAIRIQEGAYRKTLGQIRAGMSEKQIAALLEYNMTIAGADGPSFNTIVAVGSHGSIPHHVPGPRRLKWGQSLLIDFGARLGGYCGDLTRTVALGKMPRKIAEIYQIVREAQQAGIEAIAPGVELRKADAAARKVITDAGYGHQFGHGLGHGLGLEIHESPRLGQLSNGVLEVGQVVTVEPGIYLPGIGGVRIEDDVLVTPRGHRQMSALPSDLESAII